MKHLYLRTNLGCCFLQKSLLLSAITNFPPPHYLLLRSFWSKVTDFSGPTGLVVDPAIQLKKATLNKRAGNVQSVWPHSSSLQVWEKAARWHFAFQQAGQSCHHLDLIRGRKSRTDVASILTQFQVSLICCTCKITVCTQASEQSLKGPYLYMQIC